MYFLRKPWGRHTQYIALFQLTYHTSQVGQGRNASGGEFCNLLLLGLGASFAQKPLAINSQKLQCFGRADYVLLGRCTEYGFQTRAIFFGVYALGPDTLLGRPGQ